MAKLPRVTRKNRCVICGYGDYCGYTPDGNLAICMRVATGSVKQAANGGWIHPLKENDPTFRAKTPVEASPKEPKIFKPGADLLHAVYSAFLDNLGLAKLHENDLRRRGLDTKSIFLNGYKSMPTAAFSFGICQRLTQDFNLQHVPGFYFQIGGRWHFVDYFGASGYLIPIWNAQHKIVALQLRRDDDRQPKYMLISSSDKPRGASSGAPAHFATLGKAFKREEVTSLIITEGALKANIIAEFADEPVIGLVSVGCFDENFPTLLKNSYPNLSSCKIAFDMDAATNAQVRLQRDRLALTLKKINLQASVLSWDSEFKGFDDYLLHLSKQNNFKKAA